MTPEFERLQFEKAGAKLPDATILRIAKDRIVRLGWCQGDENACHGETLTGPRCAATAFMSVVPVDHPIYDLFKKANGITTSIGTWNDAPERTLEDVLAAYDKAIAAAEEIANGPSS